MKLSEFDYFLPQRLIAQHPAPQRDESRMMVVRKDSGTWEHRIFRDLPDILSPEHLLVLNNTRVFPARLRGRRPGRREQIEVLLVREEVPRHWLVLTRPSRKAPAGQILEIGPLRAVVTQVRDDGSRVLAFEGNEELMPLFEQIGEPPLPPYIRRPAGMKSQEDQGRYQTVYARHTGSVAAPTAGMHFTAELFDRLERVGIPVCEILLHVGYGTFQPVRTETIECHRMSPEYFEISHVAAEAIRRHKGAGRRLVAVGTTTTRVLEHVAQVEGEVRETKGSSNLFIYPGFQFRVIDALLTNFHLPRSTLLMLVSAFAGTEFVLECYREAISKEYRFFSFGDCMLVL
jgi:S-adenosylmethionine:tRNA ribosyltransferase-isomerase